MQTVLSAKRKDPRCASYGEMIWKDEEESEVDRYTTSMVSRDLKVIQDVSTVSTDTNRSCAKFLDCDHTWRLTGSRSLNVVSLQS